MKKLLVVPVAKSLFAFSALALIAGCATTLQKSSDVYKTKIDENNQVLVVTRDNKACADTSADPQKCPTVFYINDTNVGSYLANESNEYYLAPGQYEFQVSNCQGRCSTYDLKMTITKEIAPTNLLLSIDLKGKPFIIKK